MCIFCRISTGELPASVVYEDESTMAFLDIQPINPGHVLVIPKQHAGSLVDLSPEDAAHLMQVGQIIDKAFHWSDLKCEGVNIFLADGRAAGQDVAHIHLHVFPRFHGDGFELKIDPGSRKPPSREELNENANKLRHAIGAIQFV
ncbi:MAG: HIT family protein [Anaerolineaceae bacterium]|jgi:histidine triad (HIT) family protein|nr:HIT family protein [Anaerolineaceae bacterium]